MNIYAVLAKTPKGQEEIETRAHKLPGRLRAVLIMIDGQRTGAQLLEQAGELAEQLAGQLNDLIGQGFIEEVFEEGMAEIELPTPAAAEVEPAVVAPAPAASPSSVPRKPAPAKALPTWTTVPLEVLKARLAKMLTDSLGMRAMFLTTQINGLTSHQDLERVVDEIAQSMATTMGADAARKWRADVRGALGIPG